MDPEEEQLSPEELQEASRQAFDIFDAINRALALLESGDPTGSKILQAVRRFRAPGLDQPEKNRRLLELLDLIEGAIRDRVPTPANIAAARELTIAREIVKKLIWLAENGTS